MRRWWRNGGKLLSRLQLHSSYSLLLYQDVVSYKVTQLEPLELEEMTIATSLKPPPQWIKKHTYHV
jgi:hypothetical protein